MRRFFFSFFFKKYSIISFIRSTMAEGGKSKLNLLKPNPTSIATLSTLEERQDIID